MSDHEPTGDQAGAGDFPNVAKVPPRGPLCVTGTVHVEVDGAVVSIVDDVALCRCGHSADKPYCDGSHTRVGFSDSGVIQGGSLAGKRRGARSPDAHTDGPVRLICRRDGPVLIDGPLTVVAADGTRVHGTKGAFCRCGLSGTKPFCDGSHRRAGFRAP